MEAISTESPLSNSPIPKALCPEVPELAILCASKRIAERLIKRSEQFSSSPKSNFELLGIVQVSCFPGVAICAPVFGAPLAAALIEHLRAGGAKKILYIGSCGAIANSSNELAVGDICAPRFVRAEDGTSRLYKLPKRFEVNGELQGIVETAIPSLKNITLFSTDAPYLETQEKVGELSRLGVDAVELEFAACCAVARLHELEIAGVFVVSDVLEEPWRSGFRSTEFQGSLKTLISALSPLAFS